MTENILIIGSDGLVGSRYLELSIYSDRFLTPGVSELDICDINSIQKYLSQNKIDTIINFAAFTDVNTAETQRGNKKGLCWNLNVKGVENLLKCIDPENIRFIQISTNMVFPGSLEDPGPYEENHVRENKIENLTWYGYTKGLGENLVLGYLRDKATILRLIYPVRARFIHKLDYIRKPLKLYNEHILYPLFDDQFINITFIDDMSIILDHIIDSQIFGIFHSSSSGVYTPYEIVRYAIEKVFRVKANVKSIQLKEYLNKHKLPKYRYPQYDGLISDKTNQLFKIELSTYKNIIDRMIEQGLGKEYFR